MQAAQQALDTQLLQIYEQEIEIKGVQRYEEVRVAPLTEDEVLIIVRDVSDRKQAEFALRQLNQELEDRVERRTAALRASEERWQLALQSSNAAIWDWDVRANKTFRSTRWKELRGYQEAEIGTDTQEWQDYIHPDDRDRILAAIADHIARKTPFYQEEYRILRKDGSYLWILDRAQGLWDEAGNLIRMVGSEIDITPRKLAELEARSLRERLEFLLSASPAVIYTCEPFSPYRITFISDNIAVLSGYPPSEFLLESRFWLDHIHPDDRDRLMLESDPLYEQGYHCHEYRFLHQEGKYCWFRSELKLIRDSAGNPLEVVGYLADITDRKTVELALQESEAKLQLFVQYAPAAVAMFDQKMRYLAVSNRWKQDYQLGDRQIIGHSHYEIFPDIPEQWRAAYQRCLAGAVETCEEDSFYRPDGTIEWLRWELRPWYRADGRIGGIVLLTEIITERKQAQEQLRNLSDRLKLAIQSGAIGIWEWDVVNNVLTWDDRMYELYGISRSTFSGAYEAWTNGLHPDDRAAGETAIQAALRGEKEFDTEFRVIWADQSIPGLTQDRYG